MFYTGNGLTIILLTWFADDNTQPSGLFIMLFCRKSQIINSRCKFFWYSYWWYRCPCFIKSGFTQVTNLNPL